VPTRLSCNFDVYQCCLDDTLNKQWRADQIRVWPSFVFLFVTVLLLLGIDNTLTVGTSSIAARFIPEPELAC
jgi:hypothetical protein